MSERELHIIHLDDTEEEYMIVCDLLFDTPHIKVQWVATTASALQSIQNNTFDICIVDYYLGKTNGIEFVHEINALGIQLGFILLTGQMNQKIAEDAEKAGIHQCVDKNKLSTSLLLDVISQTIKDLG